MTFRTKKIREHHEIEREKTIKKSGNFFSKFLQSINKRFSINASILITLVIIGVLFFGIYKAISNIDFKVLLSIAGDELETDEYGHTNFLLMGSGGENHDGGDLMDTIIVASLDKENSSVSMISIPRDFFIKDEEVGNSKINEFFHYAKGHFGNKTSALEHMKMKIENLMGVPIHYWGHIDFLGFVELVDALGGVTIDVQEGIYDPYYPAGPNRYQTFSIKTGLQTLDGETALKYARSRKTTSDFDRSRRQQEIIFGIKEQALQTEIFFDQEKIVALLNTLKSNIETKSAENLFCFSSNTSSFCSI